MTDNPRIGMVLSSIQTHFSIRFKIEINDTVLTYNVVLSSEAAISARIGQAKMAELVLACGMTCITDTDQLTGKHMWVWTRVNDRGEEITHLRPIGPPPDLRAPRFAHIPSAAVPQTLWRRTKAHLRRYGIKL